MSILPKNRKQTPSIYLQSLPPPLLYSVTHLFHFTSPLSMAAAPLLFLLTSHLIFSSPAFAEGGLGMETAELSALFEVVGSLLEDPNWAHLHPHPCTDTPWPGIQCELIQQDPTFLHVTRLHIGPDLATPPCKPSATLSPSLLHLPFLKSLSLFNCFIISGSNHNVTLPPFLFTSASSLEQLVIKSNPGLSGEIPATLSLVPNLRVLTLSQNNLHGEIPQEIGGLKRLEQLDLSYNHLHGKIPEELGGLTSLTIVDLACNRLEGSIPPSFGQLQSLQKIDLSSNFLSGTIPREFGRLERLVLLDLSHNSLAGPVPETLSGLKELEYFLMESNPLETAVPLFFGALAKLAVVGLSGCGLFGPIPSCFGSLYNLTALALDRNRLSGSVPRTLGALPNLGQLNLSQNQLSGEIAFSVQFVRRLGERLDVRDNKGLCADPHLFQNLSSSPYLEATVPCLKNSSSVANNNSSLGEEHGVEPTPTSVVSRSWDEGKGDGLSSSLWYCLFVGIFVVVIFF